jgi:hypothetical protein
MFFPENRLGKSVSTFYCCLIHFIGICLKGYCKMFVVEVID